MENILDENQIKELTRLPKNFDINLIDQEHGFNSKIFPYISKSAFQDLKTSRPEVYHLLAKAGILYSFALEIPKIKVQLSNYGVVQFEQNKTRQAPWWDVRDLGLSWVKKADECLLIAFGIVPDLFSVPPAVLDIGINDLNNIYPVRSLEVYVHLSNIIGRLYERLKDLFPKCDLADFLADDFLKRRIKSYLMYSALETAVDYPGVVFLTSGFVVQYEELPWQKSLLVDGQKAEAFKKVFAKEAEYSLNMLYDYLSKHGEQFACAKADLDFKTKIVSKKSGLFL